MTLLGEEMQSVVPCYHNDVKLKIPSGKEEEEKNTARLNRNQTFDHQIRR